MTGDPIDATRAYALGLVNLVVPAASLLTEALALAERIAANTPLAVRYSKSVMQRAAEVPESEGWKINQRPWMSCSARPTPRRARRLCREAGAALARQVAGQQPDSPCSPPASTRSA